MNRLLTWSRKAHRFLINQSGYPILLSSCLAIAIWIGRALATQSLAYHFLLWNLFLAAIPYGFSLVARVIHVHYPGRWWLLAAPFLLWLIFFPNAPYLVTDLLHLDPRPPAPLWYDIGLFAAFVWSGCLIAVISLDIMRSIVKSYVGPLAGWMFVGAAVLLSGVGIYLGRFLDLNSWDLLFDPQSVLSELLVRVIHPIQNMQIYGVTVLFAAFLLVCYITFISTRRPEGK